VRITNGRESLALVKIAQVTASLSFGLGDSFVSAEVSAFQRLGHELRRG
jgi:hypothetical protein